MAAKQNRLGKSRELKAQMPDLDLVQAVVEELLTVAEYWQRYLDAMRSRTNTKSKRARKKSKPQDAVPAPKEGER
jgi:hypothetical protein